MLTTTSSLVQQVKIRATTESANTISGALVVSGGAVWLETLIWRKYEYNWKYGYCGECVLDNCGEREPAG
jgi:hypothetical protein